MKRSIISIALCVALVLSSMCAMFVMPASAANGVDFLTDATISPQEGITAEIVDGELVITATAAGQEVALVLETGANLNDYPIWEAAYTADMPYDICWNDPNNGKWIFGAGDFCYNFVGDQGAGSPLAAGSENVKFSLTTAYTYAGDPLPANAEIIQIIFIAKAAGTITVSKCALTDGIEDVSINSASYDENDAWDNAQSIISTDPADWTPAANNAGVAGEIVLNNDANGNLVFGNTAGQWPAAYADVNVTVPYADSAVYFDFSVASAGQTTIYLFFGAATETDFEGEGKGYYTVVGDVQAGNYTGYVYLEDMIPADSDLIDADGNVTISVIKAFGTTAGGAGTACESAMVLREATVYYNEVVTGPYITYTANGFTHEGNIKADEEITVDVTASAVADFAGFKFDVAFDDAAFEFVGYEWGETAAAMVAGGAPEAVNTDKEAVDGVKSVSFSVMALEGCEVAEDAVIVSVTLRAKAAITENVEIAVTDAEVISFDSITNGYELVAEGANGIIEVIPSTYEIGDVEEDGDVDIFDALALFKHVNEESLLESDNALAAADTEKDGDVDIFDALKLFKFVNEEIEEL